MPSTHLSLHYHIVFSTKNREPWMTGDVIDRVHAYIGGTIKSMNGIAHAVGGVADHVHVFTGLRATHCLADVMMETKSESSKWIHRELNMPSFEWQEGYCGFTVSASHIDAVKSYVLNRAEHHRVRTFQEEYLTMLQRGMVEYDERFLW